MADPDEPAPTVRHLISLVRAQLDRGRELSVQASDAAGSRIESAVCDLVASRVRRAVEAGKADGIQPDLVEALRAGRSGGGAARVMQVATQRFARRLGPLRAATRRNPVGLAVQYGPRLYDAVTQGIGDVETVANHLAARAREVGVEPDPAKVHFATVSALLGQHPDAVEMPDHTALLRTWLRRAGPAAMAVSDDRGSPEHVAGILEELDPARLAV